MAIHILEITDTTQFKDLAMFTQENKIVEGDKIILDLKVSYNFDFIFRKVLFLIVREGISNNRQSTGLKRLPISKYSDTNFFDHSAMSNALLDEAGVSVSIK